MNTTCAINKRAATNHPVCLNFLTTTGLSRPAVCQDPLQTIQRGGSKSRKMFDSSASSLQWSTRAQLGGSSLKLSYCNTRRMVQSRGPTSMLACQTRGSSWSTTATRTSFVDNFSRTKSASSTFLKPEVSVGCSGTSYLTQFIEQFH